MKPLLSLVAVLALGSFAVAQEEEKALDAKAVKKLQKIVEEERGMKFKHPVKVQIQNEKDLKAMVQKSFDEEWPEEKAKKEEAAYKKLGLIPQDMDLRKFMVELLTDSIGGYYDPKTKQLFLIRRSDGASNPMNEQMKQMYGVDWDTMATIHEMTHALQDQYYDLQTIPTDMEGEDDLTKAMQCVFEGEANYVMYDHVLGAKGMKLRSLPSLKMFLAGGAQGSEKMNSAPEVLKRGLAFPYMEGMVFVHAVLVKGDAWEKEEELYTTLPLSTEQILHPEKYLTPDWPQTVRMPDLAGALGKGWERLTENTLGELNVQVLLGEFLSRKKQPKTIAKAAAGWDGDRFAVYQKGESLALAWYSTWDSEDDAKEFQKAAKKALNRKLAAEGTDDGEDLTRWEGGSVLERHGSDVLWLETAGRGCEKARATIWHGTTKKEVSTVERKKVEKTETPDKPDPKEGALAENDLFRLTKGPKGAGWKVEEDGNDVTITWKGLDGAVSFHVVSKKGRDAEKALEEAVGSAKDELGDGKQRSWEIEGLDSPSAGVVGKSEELGDVKMGIMVLDAGKRWVVARLACTNKQWEKASKEFERILKGYEAK
ncbi:MAG: hypothetical protein K8T20_17230 [Planctomycetes bacterium]|nr:hypothetical protein [Planctomycetota bacterium]